ncbi:NUDIX hydrolase [Gloeothece citriformis PCC 7424]|uniref:NUDIX hydrolase n=1 Tax=Gloeothece citriformis (strain PCC 7424) TaxID=65393 RepID=B7KEP1_GLOC7|nr:NUDIX domain-containing protein [Gloeothece citriformis]ACK69066.1 NUDIX hydrolase [Gloeothece citriformis PCC 7424]
MNPTPIQVALAILQKDGQFLLQLRDDFPHIACPGQWGLFGGHLEPGESPIEGLKRELQEEIHYQVVAPELFRCYTGDQIIRHVYSASLTVPIEQLILTEGQDFALIAPDAIRSGNYYSPKIDQVRPLGQFHQQILLEFMAAELQITH